MVGPGLLNLDLHTHCLEAVGFAPPTPEVVAKIVKAVIHKGLDGIAITDHYRSEFAFQVKAIVQASFNNAVLIIPGQEIDQGPMEIVELFLPGDRVFRFIAHPGYPGSFQANGNIHGIELQNGGHYWHMDKESITQFAHQHSLWLLENSDAHYLEDIGRFYNRISWQALLSASHPQMSLKGSP